MPIMSLSGGNPGFFGPLNIGWGSCEAVIFVMSTLLSIPLRTTFPGGKTSLISKILWRGLLI